MEAQADRCRPLLHSLLHCQKKGLSVGRSQDLQWNAVMHCRIDPSTADDPVDAAADEEPVPAKLKAKRNRKKEAKPGCCSLPPPSLERLHQQCLLLCSCFLHRRPWSTPEGSSSM